MMEDAPVGSPKWWLRRLDEERTLRATDMETYRDLVDDAHPLVESAETSRKFQRMAGLSTTNLMGLAAEATAERMSVEGIRIGDEPEADKDAWRIWKDSDFDAGSDEAIASALICGRSFVSVEPPKDGKNPRLHVEDPRQVVLAYNPEGERVAALKVFSDEWTGDTFGTLYTPGYVVRMSQRGEGDPFSTTRWMARQMPAGSQAVTRNPLGEVPFFELQNRPLGEIRSELAPLVIPQRLLNQTMFNVQAIAEYGAFRQKWATGIEVPRAPDGTPIAPYEAHIAKLFVAEGAEAKFGDFNATDLKPHLDLAREIAGHMARISRLPATYFMTEVSNVGAETLALIVGGLVAKCKRRVKGYEPGLEGAMRLAFKARGADGDAARAASRIEVKWAEMETRSMAQAADAAVKLTTGDNPVITPQTAQEKWLGMSQPERDRDASWRLENGSGVDLAAMFNPDAPVAP